MNIYPGDAFYVKLLGTEKGTCLIGCEAVRVSEIEPLITQMPTEEFDEERLKSLNIAIQSFHNVQLQGGNDFWDKFEYLSKIDVFELDVRVSGLDDANIVSGWWGHLVVKEVGAFNAVFHNIDTEESCICFCDAVQLVDPELSDILDKVFQLPPSREGVEGTLSIHHHVLQKINILDVGQGLCVAIIDEKGNACGFFDMGGNLSRSVFTGAQHFLVDQLHRFPMAQDKMPVVLSHWHMDHVNMIPWISNFFEKIHWYVSAYGQPSTGRIYSAMGDRNAYITVVNSNSTQQVDVFGDYTWTVCGTDRRRSRHAHDHGLYSELLIAEGGHVLLCGDTSYDLIKNSLPQTGYRYDVLQICHHGGTYGGNQGRGNPLNIPIPTNPTHSYGVVSYGNPNRYHHPNQQVMSDHTGVGWYIYETAILGKFCSRVNSSHRESVFAGKPLMNFSEDVYLPQVHIKDVPPDSFYSYVTNLLGNPASGCEIFKSILVETASAVSSSDEVFGIKRNIVQIATQTCGNTLFLTSKLSAEINKIEIYYKDTKDYYEYLFHGKLKIEGGNPGFDIMYSSAGYITAELDTSNEVLPISSLLNVADLFGVSDVSSVLPAGFSGFDNLELDQLEIEIKPEFSGLYSFCIGLLYSQSWNIPGFEGLCSVGNPKLQFTTILGDHNIYMIELSGNIKIDFFDAEISGAWRNDRDGLIFYGILANKEVDLSEFLDAILSFIGVQDPQLPFPHIKLSSACISFDTSNSALDFNIGMAYGQDMSEQDGSVLNKLLGISSYIDVHSTVSNDGKRTFSGHFEGWLHIQEQMFTVVYEFGENTGNEITAVWSADNGLSLLDIVTFFGVKNAEKILSPLDIVCKSISLQYDIGKKDMTLSVGSNYGDLTCRLREDDSDGAVYMVKLTFEDSLTFAGLPLIDEAGDVSDIGIGNLSLTVSNGQWDAVKSGITLDGNAFCGDTVMPFEWCSNDVSDDSAPGNTLVASASIPINWNIGAIDIHSIIPGYESGQILFGADISLYLGMLAVAFENLKLTYSITDKKAGMALDGLAISGKSSSVDLEGSLLHTADNTYTGTLRVQCAKWGLQAIASYTAGANNALFAFGMLRGTLGGPPCFMLTGIGAGLGYSRELSVPGIDQLDDFALVELATGKRDIADIVGKVDEEFNPVQGSKWLAAGITANSFRMVDILILLTAQLDKNPVFNLIGRAGVSVPYGAQTPIAHAGLLVKVTIDPAFGCLPVDGMLTSDSYVLSRDCHLSGGFAFYTWYSGAHTGDFVISLGGYRSTYQKPEHYPSPQRLQLSWKLSENLSAEGSLYFALTPSCVMAGGDLGMDFAWECVQANFHAYVDILMCWKPYSYDFSVGISLKVQVKLKIFKIKLELGCDLAIWGPEFSGIAKIHLWIISFSISFGNGSRGTKTISVDEFRSSFLSAGNENTAALSAAGAYCGPTIHFLGGVIEERKKDNADIKKVSGENLEIQIDSIVPTIKVQFNHESVVSGENAACLRPCSSDDNVISVSPTLSVKMVRTDGAAIEAQWQLTPISGNLPAALWGEKSYTGETIEYTTGLVIRLQSRENFRRIVYTEVNREEDKDYAVPSPAVINAKEYDQKKAYEEINGVKNLSDKIRALFPEFSADSVDMDGFSDSGKIFNEAPLLQTIGGQA